MRIPFAVVFVTFAVSPAVLAAQAAPVPAQPLSQPLQPVTASSLLQPSLNMVANTLTSLRIDKWKKGSVRDEASKNIDSVLRDVQTNLPPLITAAGTAPGSLSAAMPLIKHLDALYDVLLRVEEASRVVAPSEQIGALQQALAALGSARFALDDELQTQATAQEKQLSDLRGAVTKYKYAEAKLEADTRLAAQRACTPAPAKPVRKKRRKPAAKKPQASSSQNAQKPAPQTSVAQKPQ